MLEGTNAHVYTDVNDDNARYVRGGARQDASTTGTTGSSRSTSQSPACRARRATLHVGTQQAVLLAGQRAQNATQTFYFVNNWHDHLLAKPIGFNEAAGNFQKVNKTGKGKGHDAVSTNTDDGANTDHGLPDGNHIDNANMSTPPDGHAPRMQMYLQHQPGTNYPKKNGSCADPCDEFSPTNVSDEADTVYHEYTHGLSGRLVVDAAGRSTLGGVQAGAMGEAWSDWYAMDYLVAKELQDRPGKVDVVLFQYDGFGVFLDRTEPMDCKVGVNSPRVRR